MLDRVAASEGLNVSVVLIAPHMDDEIVGAHTVIESLDAVVFVTDSACQWRDVRMPTEEFIRQRKSSALRVARKYGYRVVFLDFSNEFLHRAAPTYKASLFGRLAETIGIGDLVYVPSIFDQNLEHNLCGAYALVACFVKKAHPVMYSGSYPMPEGTGPTKVPCRPEKMADLQLYPMEYRDMVEVGYPLLDYEHFLDLPSGSTIRRDSNHNQTPYIRHPPPYVIHGMKEGAMILQRDQTRDAGDNPVSTQAQPQVRWRWPSP